MHQFCMLACFFPMIPFHTFLKPSFKPEPYCIPRFSGLIQEIFIIKWCENSKAYLFVVLDTVDLSKWIITFKKMWYGFHWKAKI